jgi:wyosine [tRNA(Phe)-imidazoG37] synthetase (radical SAM superfamily)
MSVTRKRKVLGRDTMVITLTIPPEIKEAIKRALDEEGFKYREGLEEEEEWVYETIEGSLIGEEYEALLAYCYWTSLDFAECTISIYGEPVASVELRSAEQVQELRDRLRLAKRILDEARRRARG